MLFAETSLGIQFHRNRVDLILLGKGLRSLEVLECETISLEPQGSFYAEGIDGVVERLEPVLTTGMRRADSVQVGLPRGLAVSMPVEVPQVKESEIRAIMRHELERQLPFPADEVWWDAQPAGARVGAMMQLLLVAIRLDRLEPYRSVLQRLDLSFGGMEISTTATALAGERELGAEGLRALVALEDGRAEITLLNQGELIHSREILLPKGDASGTDGDLPDVLWHEVSRCLASAGLEEGLQGLHLCGSGAADPTLAAELTRATGVRCGYLNPFSELGGVSPSLRDAFSLVPALGLAMRGLHRAVADVNLLPQEFRAVRSARGLVVSGVLLGLIAALGLTWLIVGMWNLGLTRDKITAGIDSLAAEVQVITTMGDDLRRVEGQIEIIQQLETSMPRKIEILRELADIIPDGSDETVGIMAWITYLKIEDRELTLRGRSEAPEGLLKILDDSPYLERVRFEASVSGGNFTIRAEITQGATITDVELLGTPTPIPTKAPTPAPGRSSRGREPPSEEQAPSGGDDEDSGPAYRIPPTPEPTPMAPTPMPEEEPEMTEEEEARQKFLDILQNSRDQVSDGPSDADEADSAASFLDILRGRGGEEEP